MTPIIKIPGEPYDHCSTCGMQSFDWPRCFECGSVALDYLEPKVKRDLAKINRDRFSEPYSELKRNGTTGEWM